MYLKTIITVSLLFPSVIYSLTIDNLKHRLLEYNHDLKIMQKRSEIGFETYKASKSQLYPTLGLNIAASTKSSQDESMSGSSASTPSSDQMPSLSSDLPAGSVQMPKDSWSADLSSSYVAFSRFSVSSNILSSKNSYEMQKIDYQLASDDKLGNLYLLLLEIQALKDMKTQLEDASKLISKIESQRRETARFQSKLEKIKFQTKKHELSYQSTRVSSALLLSREALKDLIFDFQDDEFNNLPKLKLEYQSPKFEELKDKFVLNSKKSKKFDLTIDTYQYHYNITSNWERFWIPNIALSSSYSRFGNFDNGDKNDGDFRASILFTFTLFDGFRSASRNAQAKHALEIAKYRKKSETRKNLLYLAKLHTDILNYQKEYQLKHSIANEYQEKINQLKVADSSGASTYFERSLLSLEYSHKMFDAYESLKKYQQSQISMAINLNELNKVKFHEI